MTGTGMVDLWLLLSGKTVQRPLILQRLNWAANRAVSMIRRDYTPALDGKDTKSQDSSGQVELPADIWEKFNGIDFIRKYNSDCISYRLISLAEYQRFIEKGIVNAVDSFFPKYTLRGDYICCLPINNGEQVDIYYRKAFTAIAEGSAALTDFSDRIYDIIVRLALMGVDKGMYQSAVEEIRELNNTRVMTDSNDAIEGQVLIPSDAEGHFLFEGLSSVREATAVTEDGGTIIHAG